VAISLNTSGSWAAVNATTQTVTLPTHAAGDMLIVRAGMKHATLPGDITCGTAGWAQIDEHNNGTTASSNGGGDVEIAAFWKIATSSSETNPVITYHASVSATPGCAVATSFSKGGSEMWDTPVGDSGSIAAATSYSATMGSHIAAKANDWLVGYSVTNDNTTLTVPTIAQTGLTLSARTESPATALSSATSNDISADGCYHSVTSGTSSAAAVFSGTNSVADVGAAMVIRLRVTVGVTPTTAALVLTTFKPGVGNTPYSSAVVANEPGAYWRLGEPSGGTAVDTMGSNNGSYLNTPTLGVTGAISGDSDTAVTFQAANTEYIDIGTYVGIPTGASDRTVEGWIKTTNSGSDSPIYVVGAYSGTLRTFWAGYLNSSGVLAWTDSVSFLTFGSAINDGNWHHVVFTYTGTTLRAYIDGSEASGSPQTLGGALDTSGAGNQWIAANGSAWLEGSLDEVALYTSVLSAGEIANHWGIGSGTAGPQTVTPTTAALATATFAPTIAHLIPVPVAALTLATFAPTVTVATATVVTPDAAALTLATFAPTIEHKIVVPVAALSLTPFAPVLKSVIPVPVASLTTTPFAPTIGHKITVPVATVALTTFAPTVSVSGATLQSLINAASPGATVSLGGNTYHESVTINKALTIQGPGTIDGDNTRSTWVVATANDVVVDNITFINAAAGAVQDGSIDFTGVLRGIVRNCNITGGAYASVRFWLGADDGLVEFNTIHDSPVCGVLAYQSDGLTIDTNEIYDCNLDDIGDPGWESGGVKTGECLNTTLTNNTVYNCHGPGLWADISNDNWTCTGNRVYDCTRGGLMFEISDTALIDNNVVYHCGSGFPDYWWGAGILSSSSINATITNNLVAWCSDGISVVNQDRDDGPHPEWSTVAGVDVSDNTIIMGMPVGTGESYALGWFKDFVGGNIFTVGTNFGNTNIYWYPGTPHFAWNGDITSLSSFNATDGETGGTLMTVAARDAALIADNVPIDLPIPTPSTAALTLTTFAPTVSAGGAVTVTVPVATLSLATFAPTVSTPRLVTVPVATLTTATFAPTVSAPRLATPTTATLTLSTFAPTALAPRLVTVPVAALSLTTFEPTVTAGGAVLITVPVAALSLSTFAPTASTTANMLVTVPVAGLVTATFAPTVSVAAAGAVLVTVPFATLSLTTHAPHVRAHGDQGGGSKKGRNAQTPFDDWTIMLDDEAIVELYLLMKGR